MAQRRRQVQTVDTGIVVSAVRTARRQLGLFAITLVGCLLMAALAHADATSLDEACSGNGVLDNVLCKYKTAASHWSQPIQLASEWLFWTLVVINMVWQFSMNALRRGDIMEVIAELTRFTIFVGFYYWLLQHGTYLGETLIKSLRQLAAKAGSVPNALSPSGIVDVGLELLEYVISHATVLALLDGIIGFFLALFITFLLTTVALDMLLLSVTAWVLLYAGVFFLGFGGSKWTSEMAIAYFRTTLSIAVQSFAMILLVSIGKAIIDELYPDVVASDNNFLHMLGSLFVVAYSLYKLCGRIPPLLGGIVTGGAGASASTAGSSLADGMVAAMTIQGAFRVAGSAAVAGVSEAAGAVQAFRAATGIAHDQLTQQTKSGEGGAGTSSAPLAAAFGDRRGTSAGAPSNGDESLQSVRSATGVGADDAGEAGKSSDSNRGAASGGSTPPGQPGAKAGQRGGDHSRHDTESDGAHRGDASKRPAADAGPTTGARDASGEEGRASEESVEAKEREGSHSDEAVEEAETGAAVTSDARADTGVEDRDSASAGNAELGAEAGAGDAAGHGSAAAEGGVRPLETGAQPGEANAESANAKSDARSGATSAGTMQDGASAASAVASGDASQADTNSAAGSAPHTATSTKESAGDGVAGATATDSAGHAPSGSAGSTPPEASTAPQSAGDASSRSTAAATEWAESGAAAARAVAGDAHAGRAQQPTELQTAARAARIAAGAAASMARDRWNTRIAGTMGGQIAAALKKRSAAGAEPPAPGEGADFAAGTAAGAGTISAGGGQSSGSEAGAAESGFPGRSEAMTSAQARYLSHLSTRAGQAFDPDMSKADATRLIADLRSGHQPTGVRAADPMTGSQATYLKRLCAQARQNFDPSWTVAEASERIDQLLDEHQPTGVRDDGEGQD